MYTQFLLIYMKLNLKSLNEPFKFFTQEGKKLTKFYWLIIFLLWRVVCVDIQMHVFVCVWVNGKRNNGSTLYVCVRLAPLQQTCIHTLQGPLNRVFTLTLDCKHNEELAFYPPLSFSLIHMCAHRNKIIWLLIIKRPLSLVDFVQPNRIGHNWYTDQQICFFTVTFSNSLLQKFPIKTEW